MSVRNIKIGNILDAARWAKSACHAAMKTPPGSREREQKLDEINDLIEAVRQHASQSEKGLSSELNIALLIATRSIERIRSSPPRKGRGRYA